MANLWDKPGVPHKGWSCAHVYDVRGDGCSQEDATYETCEMCGKEKIRYVHVMEHMDHDDLSVGCICAQKMSGDYFGPLEREAKLRNKASRKLNWLKRKWKTSSKGNQYLKLSGHQMTVFQSKYCEGRWAYNLDKSFSRKNYATQDAAKLALFEEYDALFHGE